ncbi:hypothetical protein ACFSQ7_13450 [Paenibacillus rhizoplanae]
MVQPYFFFSRECPQEGALKNDGVFMRLSDKIKGNLSPDLSAEGARTGEKTRNF